MGPLFGEPKPAGDTFEPFWAAYPRKIGKFSAQKAWRKLSGNTELVKRIMLALEQQKANNWMGKSNEFVPYPATWINGERWNDEIETQKKAVPARHLVVARPDPESEEMKKSIAETEQWLKGAPPERKSAEQGLVPVKELRKELAKVDGKNRIK